MAEIEVSKVRVAKNRKARPEAVAALVESIGEIGLLNPIILDDDNNLIAGVHRLEAHKKLGERMIEFRRSDLDTLGRELARIDENLCRNQMTAMERGDALKDRQEIWEQLHPEVKQGGQPGKKGGGKQKSKTATVAGFAKDTATKTGTSERSVQRHTHVAKGLDVEAKLALQEIPAAQSPGITELEKLVRLGPEKQREVAAQVAKTGETVKAATRALLRRDQVAQVRVYQPPAGEFAVIVADPPWQYGDQLDGSDASRGGCPYPTMPLADILELKPPAAEDCVLWLWTTNAFIADGSAAAVVKAWGFESKTVLTWVKPRMGLGRWLRNVTEHCILAVRGSPKVDLTNQTTMMMAPLGEHSAKPDLFYRMVEQLCPSPSRIEMFARADRPGWVTTGAELGKKRLDGKEAPAEVDEPKPWVAPKKTLPIAQQPKKQRRTIPIVDVPAEAP